MTGFDTSPLDEFGLQAFYLGQYPSVVYFSIMLSGFLKALASKEPEYISKFMDTITAGYKMGRKAKPLTYVVWEDMWERNLADIRKEYNINL